MQSLRKNRRHGGDARLAAGKVETVERVGEHVGDIERRIADQAGRVDDDPAAFTAHDVLVMQIAVQRLDISLPVDQCLRQRGALDIGAVHAVSTVLFGLAEQALKIERQRQQA